MGIFDFFKKGEVIDLSEKYRRQQESEVEGHEEGSIETDFVGSIEERRKRLAKRIADMTDKIEDLSNKFNSLTQRIEVLERKLRPTSEQSE